MKRIKVLGPALVAVFAVSAVASSAALAVEPEFKPEKGVFPVTFSGSSTAASKLVTKANGTVECKSDSSSGEVTSAKEAKSVVVKFKECESEGFIKAKCTTAGKATGEIETTTLKARPVYIKGNRTTKVGERGMDLEPATAGNFAKFKCENSGTGTEVTVENTHSGQNSVIGVINAAEVGVQRNTVTLHFNQTGGKQEPKEYENETGLIKTVDFLESTGKAIGAFGKAFAAEESAEQAVETLTFGGGEKVELT
jgi:hypothetical protein